MYKDVLRAIDGIEVFPVFSFVVFFTFFIVLGIYVFTMDKSYVKFMSDKPLDLDADEESSYDGYKN